MVSVRTIGALTAAATMMAATPAMAETVVFNFLTAGQGGGKYSATVGDTTVNVRVSAWTAALTGNHKISSASLQKYDKGFGIITSTDNGGRDNLHTIDNNKSADFILLQFDQAVRLDTGVLNAFSVLGGPADNDAYVGFANTDKAWNQNYNLSGFSYDALFDGYSVKGTGSSAPMALNPTGEFANLWVVGADFFGIDSITYKDGRKTKTKDVYDGFKLSSLVVTTQTAVPEPATWAMMIAGFGLVGAGLRRRSRSRVAVA